MWPCDIICQMYRKPSEINNNNNNRHIQVKRTFKSCRFYVSAIFHCAFGFQWLWESLKTLCFRNVMCQTAWGRTCTDFPPAKPSVGGFLQTSQWHSVWFSDSSHWHEVRKKIAAGYCLSCRMRMFSRTCSRVAWTSDRVQIDRPANFATSPVSKSCLRC